MSVTPFLFLFLEFFLVHMKLECLPRYLLVFPWLVFPRLVFLHSWPKEFAFLLKQFHLHRLAHLLPGQIQPLLFVLPDLAFRSSDRIEDFARWIPHLP